MNPAERRGFGVDGKMEGRLSMVKNSKSGRIEWNFERYFDGGCTVRVE